MAFAQGLRAKATLVAPGDGLAVYVTRGAFHNPTRDYSQFAAAGETTSSVYKCSSQVSIRNRTFTWCMDIDLRIVLPERRGVPAKALVRTLDLVRRKDAWGQYFRSGLVEVSDSDFRHVYRALEAAAINPEGSTE
jgi:hypothetical protein